MLLMNKGFNHQKIIRQKNLRLEPVFVRQKDQRVAPNAMGGHQGRLRKFI